ncbi:MAG: amidohydrolase [Candidatus Kariarchaeaceae archaeon]|jgi:imidazolonepropionase-like amidohydrolase
MELVLIVSTFHSAIRDAETDIFIHVKDGKIIDIGPKGSQPSDIEILEYPKSHATPGLVDGHSHIGLFYEGYYKEQKDGNESAKPLTPELRAIDGFWPFDSAINQAVAGGVTTVCVLPGSANLIGGLGAVIKLKTSDLADSMALNPEVAMKVALGINPKETHSKQKKSPMTRMASAALIRQAFFDTREYVKKRGEENPPALDLGKENLARILRKDLPVFAHCARTDDIVTLLRLQEEFEFDLVLHHAYEAHISQTIIDELVKRRIQVILGPSFRVKGSSESQLFSFESQQILMDAGVPNVSQMTDHPVIPSQYLPMQAALCVREGLDNNQ